MRRLFPSCLLFLIACSASPDAGDVSSVLEGLRGGERMVTDAYERELLVYDALVACMAEEGFEVLESGPPAPVSASAAEAPQGSWGLTIALVEGARATRDAAEEPGGAVQIGDAEQLAYERALEGVEGRGGCRNVADAAVPAIVVPSWRSELDQLLMDDLARWENEPDVVDAQIGWSECMWRHDFDVDTRADIEAVLFEAWSRDPLDEAGALIDIEMRMFEADQACPQPPAYNLEALAERIASENRDLTARLER